MLYEAYFWLIVSHRSLFIQRYHLRYKTHRSFILFLRIGFIFATQYIANLKQLLCRCHRPNKGRSLIVLKTFLICTAKYSRNANWFFFFKFIRVVFPCDFWQQKISSFISLKISTRPFTELLSDFWGLSRALDWI